MNDERDKTTIDRQVSDTYRALANERVPRPLNDKILGLATNAKPARSLIPGGWMKPVAWAATIGLSLAIVLELTQVPSIAPDTNGVSPSVSVDGPEAHKPVMTKTSAGTTADERPDRQARPAEMTTIDGPSPVSEQAKTQRERQDLKPELHRAEMPVTEEAAAAPMSLVPRPLEAAPIEDGLAAADADERTVPRAADAVSSMAVSAEKTGIAGPSLCPARTRETAADWFRCIEAQRESATAEAINRETQAFRKQFPDYPIPDTDK